MISRTMHFTGANHSSVPRRAYILGFGLPTTSRASVAVLFPGKRPSAPPAMRAGSLPKKSRQDKQPYAANLPP